MSKARTALALLLVVVGVLALAGAGMLAIANGGAGLVHGEPEVNAKIGALAKGLAVTGGLLALLGGTFATRRSTE